MKTTQHSAIKSEEETSSTTNENTTTTTTIKKTTKKEEKKLVFTNTKQDFSKINCFHTEHKTNLCYNQSRPATIEEVEEGTIINFRDSDATYKPDNFISGKLYGFIKEKEGQNACEKRRGQGLILVVGRTFRTCFFDDSLIWGENSVEPKHEILKGVIGWGGNSRKKVKNWVWTGRADIDYVAPVRKTREKKPKISAEEIIKTRENDLLEKTATIDALTGALEEDEVLKQIIRNLGELKVISKNKIKSLLGE